MFMDRKAPYGQDVSSSQLDPWVQCNPNFKKYQQVKWILTTCSKSPVERQMTQTRSRLGNTDGELRCRMHVPPSGLTIKPQESTETVWCWGESGQIDRWNRTGSPEIHSRDPHTVTDLWRGSKDGAHRVLNTPCWNTWTSTYKGLSLDTDLTPSLHSLKWVTDLSRKCRTMKLLEAQEKT